MTASTSSSTHCDPSKRGGPVPDPTPIIEMATAYWQSQILLAARRLDLFTHLAESPKTAPELARATELPERPLTLLLQAATALGLLKKEGQAFGPTPVARSFLVRGSPADLGPALEFAADQYAVWGRLADSVQKDRPALDASAYLGDDEDRTRHFVLGMHHRALGTAPSVIAQIDLGDRKRLLDIGGGPGTYAAMMMRSQPALRATVFDLPAVAAIAKKLIDDAGLSGRIDVQAGDYTKDDFGSGYDLVLISGVLHRESPEDCAALIGKAARSLAPGGRMVLSDIMLSDDRTSPTFATLFALHMFLTSPHGGAHSISEHRQWLEAAGLEQIRHITLPPPLNYTVVTAEIRGDWVERRQMLE